MFPLIVPELTLSPAILSTGIGSPEIIDSSIVDSPSFMLPSTGIFSPGLTRNKSPFRIESIATSCSLPSMIFVALFGASFNSSLIALLVFPCALASKSWPNKTSVSITVEASKYTYTVPACDLN